MENDFKRKALFKAEQCEICLKKSGVLRKCSGCKANYHISCLKYTKQLKGSQCYACKKKLERPCFYCKNRDGLFERYKATGHPICYNTRSVGKDSTGSCFYCKKSGFLVECSICFDFKAHPICVLLSEIETENNEIRLPFKCDLCRDLGFEGLSRVETGKSVSEVKFSLLPKRNVPKYKLKPDLASLLGLDGFHSLEQIKAKFEKFALVSSIKSEDIFDLSESTLLVSLAKTAFITVGELNSFILSQTEDIFMKGDLILKKEPVKAKFKARRRFFNFIN